MNEIKKVKRLKAINRKISDELKKMGLIPVSSYKYVEWDEQARKYFSSHTLDFDAFLKFHQNLGEKEVLKQVEKFIWFLKLKMEYAEDEDAFYEVHYDEFAKEIAINEVFDCTLGNFRCENVIEKLEENLLYADFSGRIEEIKIKKVFSYREFEQATAKLMDDISDEMYGCTTFTQADVKNRIKEMMERIQSYYGE